MALVLVAGIITPTYAMFLTPVEIIDKSGDGGGNMLNGAANIATDLSGNVFVVGAFSENVFKITPTGTITKIIDSVGDGSGNVLTNPVGVATDSSGNVFVTGLGSENVFKITPTGTITKIIDMTGDGGGNMLDQPFSIATDLAGNVFVAGFFSDNVFKITPTGTITKIIDMTGDGGGNMLESPLGVATDSLGNVFVTGLDSANAFKITPGGTITEIIDSLGDRSGNMLTAARGVATDLSGNVFVIGTITNAFKIAIPGTCSTGGTPCTITKIIDNSGDGGGNTFDNPGEIATDSLGNVFVTGLDSDNVFKINTPGTCSTDVTPCTITVIIDMTGDGGGNMLDRPTDVATDLAGNVFVVALFSDNAFKLEPEEIVVGGEFSPIDSTALVLAGLQTSAIWMIPVVLSGIGIGLFVVSRKSE